MTSEPAVAGLLTRRLPSYVGQGQGQVYRCARKSGALMWIFAIILGLPLVEIGLFVTLGAWLGLWATLGIVLGTAIFGFWLIRRQGQKARLDLRHALASGLDPMQALAADGLGIIAGVLLILPGFLTDTMGLLLLIPWVQRAMARVIANRSDRQMRARMAGRDWPPTPASAADRPDPDVIDGTWEELPKGANRGESGWTRH